MQHNTSGKCIICGNNTKYSSRLRGLAFYCSKKCSNSCPKRKEKFKNSYPTQQAKLKRENTCFERYGYKNMFSDTKRVRESMIDKYGVDNPAKLQRNRELNRKRQLENNTSFCDIPEPWKSRRKLFRYKTWLKIALQSGMSYATISKRTCIPLSTIQKDVAFHNLNQYISAYKPYSDAEIQIYDYLKSLDDNIVIERNVRGVLSESNGEVDLYIPEKNVAIEYNGIYWHSTAYNSDPYRHYNKTKLFHGRMLQIFDYEWVSKENIVKDILVRALFPEKLKVLYARNLTANIISSKEAKCFLEKNHIQSYRASSMYFALKDGDDTISILTVTKKQSEYELVRYATKLGYSVVGGIERMWKLFLRTCSPEQVYSYCDLRYFVGNVYKRLGFLQVDITKPNYFYVDSNGNYAGHRYRYMKHKLNTNLTENEYMLQNNYNRVYDCGNIKFVWKV